jgi:hypothetical protein
MAFRDGVSAIVADQLAADQPKPVVGVPGNSSQSNGHQRLAV